MMTAQQYFTLLTEKIEDITPGKMFSAACIKTANGKVAAMLWHDFLIVKLPDADLKAALKIKGVTSFEPMEGRKMNGWIQIPFSESKSWERFLLRSIELVKALPHNKTARKKK